MRSVFITLLVYVLAMRAFEVARSKRNEVRVLARGGRRVDKDGFVGIVLVHTAWIVGMIVEELMVGPSFQSAFLRFLAFILFVASEILRLWCIITLGDRWNVRVIVTGKRPVMTGPYAVVDHPNYWAVLIGLVALPLSMGLVWSALLVIPAKLIALFFRIRIENEALRGTS